jgi:cytochrome P450
MVEYNPFSPEAQYNPYPILKQLRDEAPIYHNPDFDFYCVTRYDDALAVFLDTQNFISGNGVTIGPKSNASRRLNSLDPPEHTIVRKMLARLFTPRSIGDLEPFVRATAQRYLDAGMGKDEFDIVQEFSLRLPMDVISELIGLPEEYRETVHELTTIGATRGIDPNDGLEESMRANMQMASILQDLVKERRKNPKDDVISTLITAAVVDDDGVEHRLDDELIAAQFHLLAGAGHETVMKLIGNGTIALWWYPDQRAELVADPSLIPGAVEEMLRWDNPAPIEARWSLAEVELPSGVVPADKRVVVQMGAANHDERRYENPELFDIHRKIDRPLGFGFGLHLCLGAALARLEARVAFEEILKRYPNYEVVESGVNRGAVSFFRGLRNVPITAGA